MISQRTLSIDSMEQQNFVSLLQAAFQKNASDIHLMPGSAPAFRIKGEIRNVNSPPLTDQDILQILGWIISDKNVKEKIQDIKDFDSSFEIKNLCRFRINVYRHRFGFGVIFRIIPATIPTIEQLSLPKALVKIAEIPRGLVLVTGATGSGKSSTLAAMVHHINATFHAHILTIEDPIEFIHTQKKSRITQREIGSHTETFAGALRSALRQDPDVILVGEMRDSETIDIALKAAETGHLVLSTIHTTDAIKTIGRLVSVFSPNEQKMVRLRLADNLVSTISQRLIKKADGKGMVAAQEIMISNGAIQECIANPDLTGQMNDYISKSHDSSGGQTFEQHLAELYRSKLITLEEAKSASTNPQDFERNLLFGSNSHKGNSQDIKGLNETVMLDDGKNQKS